MVMQTWMAPIVPAGSAFKASIAVADLGFFERSRAI
jgi:hypothetical protein